MDTLHPMRWNWSSRRPLLSGGDAIVLSIPKSGRTWVRVFLSAYFSAKNSRPFALDITDYAAMAVPRIVYSHDRFESHTKSNVWEWLRGKYLVPDVELKKARVILLARDPRDAFCSYYVQLTRRNHPAPESIKKLPIDILLRHPRYGIAVMVTVMNSWMREFGTRGDFGMIRYEDLGGDPRPGFTSLLDLIGETEIDRAAFEQALQFSSFENMHRLEAGDAFRDKVLMPADRRDPESFKVRRGKVGGFREYLSAESQRYAAQACARLDGRFGYLGR